MSIRFSLHHTHGRGDVGIIAADCGANVLLTCKSIDSGIETYPANPRKQSFHPGMGCAVRRGMRSFTAVVKVAADIATGNSGVSHEGNHDVSKILTYALPRAKRILDRRIDCSAFLYVAETSIHSRCDVPQECQGTSSLPFSRSDLHCQLFKLWRGTRKMTGHQHVPVVFFFDELFQFLPPIVVLDFWNRGLGVDIYQGVGDDGQLAVTGRQVEVVDKIAVGIGVAKNPRPRIDR